VETGRITRRIAPGKGEIVSLAASPDGSTLYFAPEARSGRSRPRVVKRERFEPAIASWPTPGRALLVSVLESPNMRLFRVPLDGSLETEIPADAAHA